MGRWGSRRKKETNEKQGENSSREIARLHSQALTFLFDKLVQKAGLSHTHVTCIHKQKQMKPNSTFIRARLCEHVCVCVCVCVCAQPPILLVRPLCCSPRVAQQIKCFAAHACTPTRTNDDVLEDVRVIEVLGRHGCALFVCCTMCYVEVKAKANEEVREKEGEGGREAGRQGRRTRRTRRRARAKGDDNEDKQINEGQKQKQNTKERQHRLFKWRIESKLSLKLNE